MEFCWKTEGYHKLTEMLTSVMVAVTGDVSLLDNTILNNCHTVIKRSSAYFWIPISEQHQRELAFLWLLPGTTALALGHSLILRDLQHLSSLQHLLVCYWVGQKFHSGFSLTYYGKTQTNSLAKPIQSLLHCQHLHGSMIYTQFKRFKIATS